MRFAVPLVMLGLLGGCATGPMESRADTLDRLVRDCHARGGILTATGATTGRPETENACVIRGASRIPR
jgi:hypothetical protein